jgi:hypothetical protein
MICGLVNYEDFCCFCLYNLSVGENVDFRSREIQQCGWSWSHAKGRAHMGGMGIGKKPKT